VRDAAADGSPELQIAMHVSVLMYSKIRLHGHPLLIRPCEICHGKLALGTVISDAGIVGAPPSGRWVVVCEADRGEGVAPTKSVHANTIGPDQ
jgi:hypothetical protein